MFEVRLNVDPQHWTVGESMRLAMPTAEAKEVLTVPRDTLVPGREGASVFRLNADMTAEQLNVSTGPGVGKLIEVFGDLGEGGRVVIRGAERLRTGMAVSVQEDTSASANSLSQAAN
jgi:multidrug efflux pump subunit AcrA (membrane-fusion protein)